LENNTNISDQFGLPDGYFDRSRSFILNKIEWQNEQEAYPTLLGLKGKHGFVIPPDYFNNSELKLELIPFEHLNDITKQNSFKTPTAYFESVKLHINSKLEAKTELSEYVSLHSISKELPFTVDANYFENSKKVVLSKTFTTEGAKIILLNRKPIWLAAAALLTIVFSLWIYNAYFNQTEVIDGDCNTLACIEKRELLKYKLDNLDNEELYELVNSQKLEERLNKIEKTDSLKTTDSIDASVLDYIE
jgi:hypothetical protein